MKEKLYKTFKKFFIPSVVIIIILILLVRTVLADAGEDFWGTFYSDGTYEYEFGYMHYYDNGSGSPYNLHTDPIPDNYHWTDADERVNFRDRAKNTHNGDSRGWTYWKTEWQNYDNINKYKGTSGDGSYGYSEYTSNSYNPISAFGASPYGGIQDGGAKIYWGNNTWNRYRRAALKLYYRLLPTPWHGQQYIAGTKTSGSSGTVGDSNYYQDGSIFWIQPNKAFTLRSWAYDLYPNEYGQQAQYAANVRSTTFFLHNDSLSYAVARQVDHKYDTASVYSGRDTHPASVLSAKNYWRGYEYGTREVYDGLYRNGNGAQLTLSLPNQLSLKVMTDHLNKQGRWTSNSIDGWNSTFYTPVGAATRLNTDGDVPTIADAYIENADNWGFDIVVTGITDNGGSGVKRVSIPVWTDNAGQDDIKWYSVDTTGGNIRLHINRADHKNELGLYRIELYPVDNLSNYGFRKSLTAEINEPLPDLEVTNDIVSASSDTSIIGNLKNGQSYRVKTTIRNSGERNAGAFTVSIGRKDGPTYSSFNLGGLTIGASATYYTPFTASSVNGEWGSFISTADVTNVVTEKSETNNTATATRYIEGGINNKPTAVISGLSPIPKGTNPNINSSQSNPNDPGDSIFVSDWSLSVDGGNTYQSSSLSGVNGIKDLLASNEKFKIYKIGLRVCDDGIGGKYSMMWSDAAYKDFVVYNPNTKPTSNFAMATSVLEGQNINFVDQANANDPWDSIQARRYSLDGGQTWTTTKPTVLSLAGVASSTAYKDFNIGYVVDDQGHTYSSSLTSTPVYKTVRVYRGGSAPIADFTVSPTVVKLNGAVTYINKSYDPDPWDSISQIEWGYRKIKDQYGNAIVDTWKNGNPSSFGDFGEFEIRLRVKDTGNSVVPAQWSGYAYKTVKVSKPDLIITSMQVLDSMNSVTDVLQGNNYTIKVVVQNSGEVTSDPNILKIYDKNNSIIATQNVSALLPTQSLTINIPYSVPTNLLGAYEMIGKVDYDNVINELREDNNTKNIIVSVYAVNRKPIAKFTVTPGVQEVYKPLVYTDQSYDPDPGDSISKWEWSYRKTKDETGALVSDSWKIGNPSQFSAYGTYETRLRVQDKGNLLSPPLWSDYYIQTVDIKPSISISGTISPNPSEAGRKLTLNIRTTGNAKKIKITFPPDLVKLATIEDPLIFEREIKIEETHNEVIYAWLPLEAAQTLDDKGFKLRLPYIIEIEAENQYGAKAKGTISLDVRGSVMDGIKTRIRASGYDKE